MLARMCMPEQGPASDRLVRDLFGLHRVVRRGTSGREYHLFALPHGEWVRLMARCGLIVEDLIEVQVPPGSATNDFPEFPTTGSGAGPPRRSGSPAADPPAQSVNELADRRGSDQRQIRMSLGSCSGCWLACEPLLAGGLWR